MTAGGPVYRRFADLARSRPDAVAVLAGSGRMSYGEMLARCEALADRLVAGGARVDRPVAVVAAKDGPEWVVAALACWAIGAVYLPVEAGTPAGVAADMLDGSSVPVVTGPGELIAPVCAGRAAVAFDSAEATAGPAASSASSAGSRAVPPDTLAYIVHTSGTTGRPKPVGVSHRALLAAHTAWTRLHGLGTDVRTHLQVSSLAFDVHVAELVRALLSGGTLVLCPIETVLDPPALHALISAAGVDLIDVTPTVLRPLVAFAAASGTVLPVRRILVGGEPWTVADLARLRAVVGPTTAVGNAYGLVETTVDSTFFDTANLSPHAVELPIGAPVPGTDALVLGPDLRPVPAGGVGQLFVLGPHVARGYPGRAGQTAARFVPVPDGHPASAPGARMFATGDLVRRDPGGALVFVGRSDDEVKVDGVRVSLTGVEAVLAEHPEVTGAAVVRVAAGAGPALVAHVQAAAGSDDGLADRVRAHAAGRLPATMVPSRVLVCGSLPVNAVGKVDRAALARIAAAPPGVGGSPVAAAPVVGAEPGSLAARIAGLWATVLGQPPRIVTDDFFAAGGTSMGLARLAALLRAEFGGEVPLAQLRTTPTVRGQADLLGRLAAGTAPPAPVPPADGVAPLAPEQRRLWLLHRLAPDSGAYLMPMLVRLTGPLRADLVRRTLEVLVDRHEALRVGLTAGPGQRIHPAAPVPVELVDLCDLPAGARDAAATRLLAERAARPVDLAGGRPLRAVLVRRDADRHDLLLVVHHIVFDAWSEQVLLREFGVVYAALQAGGRPDLPALAGRYLDVMAGLAARPGGSAEQREFWRRTLADLPAPLALPPPVFAAGTPAGTPPDRPAGSPGIETRDLPARLAGRIAAHAAAARTTRPVVLLAALTTLLARWTGQHDLVIGVPFVDRDRPETAGLVGFFVRSLPVRLTVPAGGSFADVVGVVWRALNAAIAHADVPFDVIVHDAGRAGAAGHNPLFRIWFNPQDGGAAAVDCGGVTAELVEPPVPGALFPFGWYVTETPSDVRVRFVYEPADLDRAHAAALVDQYERLLDRVCAAPTAPIASHGLRAPAPGTRDARPEPGTSDLRHGRPDPAPLVPALVRAGTAHAARTALVGTGRTVTHAGLWAWTWRVTGALSAAGAGPGSVVALYGRRCVELVPALLGVLAAGASVTVLDADQPTAAVASRLRRCRVRLGVVLPGAPAPDGVLRSSCPQWTDLPAPPPDGTVPDLVATCDIDPDYVLFTSGTTGEPKAVRSGTAAVSHFLAWYAERFAIGPDDRFALLAGLGYDPLMRDVLTPVWAGAALHAPPPKLLRSPVDLLDWLRRSEITVAHLTPALCRLVSTAAGARTVPSLRLVCCGGDHLHAADVAGIAGWAPGATIVNGYGTTETPQLAAYLTVDRQRPPLGAVPVGPGAPGWELLVLDPTGRPAAPGELGPVVARGPHLSHDAEPTGADRFQTDPVPGHRRFVTGDLGRYTPDGDVILHGRLDDQVKVRGHRAELGEIDRHLRAHPHLADAAAATRAGADGENEIVAGLVPAGDPATRVPGSEQLRRFLRRWLPEHLLPVRAVAVPAVPLTANGKVDRAALRALVASASERASTGPGRALSGPLAGVVATVWRHALDRDDVGPDENFFDAGASSILVIRAHLELERRTGRVIPVTALFEYPTVRELAAFLQRGDEPAVPVDAGRRAEVPTVPDLRARRLAARAAARQEETHT